jgi:hypothetical protein
MYVTKLFFFLCFLVWKHTIWQPCFASAVKFYDLIILIQIDCLTGPGYTREEPPKEKCFHLRWGRVARWLILEPKISIWVNYRGHLIGKYCYILWPLEYFTDIWDILWPFGTFWVHLVHFFGFGFIYQEKFCKPALRLRKVMTCCCRHWK